MGKPHTISDKANVMPGDLAASRLITSLRIVQTCIAPLGRQASCTRKSDVADCCVVDLWFVAATTSEAALIASRRGCVGSQT
jgi:hypothetical protein